MKNVSQQNGCMEKLFAAQSAIKKRLTAQDRLLDGSVFVSDRFLIQLYNILEAHRENIKGIDASLRMLLAAFDTYLNKIRYELSQIPVEFVVVSIVSRYTLYGTPETGLALQHGEHKSPLPDAGKRQVGERVWSLCSRQQADEMSAPYLPNWNAYDTPLDWIIAFVETDEPADTDLTKAALIYRYIVTNCPVGSRAILEQNFAKRSRTFAILKQLERDGKIEKNAHGVYNTVSTL